jgi:membrane protein involved in colicin uptake
MSRGLIVTALFAGVAGVALFAPGTASALTMEECSAKYNAAKKADKLKGMSWNDFRKAECGSDAAAEKSNKKAKSAEEEKSAADKAAKPKAKSSEPMKGDPSKAVFPRAISSKYAKEKPSKARMHTCLDQYNANKETNANGGLNWIQKGGGYYSECNKRLKG